MGRLPRSARQEPLAPSPSPILRREEQRLALISGLEEWLHELHGMDAMAARHQDVDVHECALRTVCEVAMVPSSEGLMGELLHLLLTPRDVLPKLPAIYRANEYIQAQIDGGMHGDCSNYERKCGVSFFQVRRTLLDYTTYIFLRPTSHVVQMLDGHNLDQLQEEFVKMYGAGSHFGSSSSSRENDSNAAGSQRSRDSYE